MNKDEAQAALAEARGEVPIGVYEHRKGGIYVVFHHSLNEATLEPLVHYYSLLKKTAWTRTLADFIEEVEGKARFWRMRQATLEELLEACGIEMKIR